ncbi:lysophospholipid acyltransferase family protein [Sphingomonas sp. KR1UV-12]|uniref:Lysophospholipid acyltransferase family protein n=1 Tax=Sphingomonas aurea TaxID=3063994 RepID=A0ABT9ELI5_9SPHN|nr:lysophospholipid acyltransferase family protein [Sphingomonas sp. KR1UV-12]MDP1027682.1 lysophospholipid acyltransferase family protein [Sphingomonas sp. KR1UV-12]
MVLLRNIAFSIVFWGLSVPIVATAPISALFGRRAIVRHATAWTLVHRWAVRHLLGIRVKVEGVQPTTPVFYAAKHQSMWETLELQCRLGGPAMVLKRELANIPVWGWSARCYGAIVVDREAAGAAMRGMMREAEAARLEGRSILIFPEGTRVAPGEQPPLKPGFAGLYRILAMPTVPIATDIGLLWPRRGLKRPGVVTLRFGDVIPPGLPRRVAEAAIHAGMNALER